jgi:hypothetical protein
MNLGKSHETGRSHENTWEASNNFGVRGDGCEDDIWSLEFITNRT